MPPKKAKAKKEEVIEIPKPHTLPDGKKSHFIGGWSKTQSLSAIGELVKADPDLENVFVLPSGTTEGNIETKEESVVAVRSFNLIGLLPALKAPKTDAKPAAEAGEGEEGEAAAEEEAAGEDEEEKPQVKKEKVLFADRAVTVKGLVRFEAAPKPVPVVVTPDPVPEPVAAPKGKTKGKTAVVKEDPAEVAAREAAAAAAREAAEAEAEKGAAPSKWPVLEVSNLFFDGEVIVKGVHVNFVNCHFAGGAANQLSIHQYCKVTLTKCSFASPVKSALYLYPKSDTTVTDCIFSGELLPQNVEEHEAKVAAGVTKVLGSAVDEVNNVGLFADDAKVTVTDCVFDSLATGILFNDKCEDSVLVSSHITYCRNNGVYCAGTSATIRECFFANCGYYGMRFEGSCNGKVLRNHVAAQCRVGAGAHPFLHSNMLSNKLIDLNEKGTVSLEPKY